MFQYVDPWELALWAVAAYLAIVSLVRLVRFHRQRLVARFREQLQSKRRRQQSLILTRKERAGKHAPRGPLESNRTIHRYD
jgi:hypothetical protein